MRAFVTDGNGSGSVETVETPTPGPGEILVKVHYAALNPGDWKLVEGNVAAGPAPKGLISGCDFAGSVADANGSQWSLNQRVAGFVHGTSLYGTEANPNAGAFAEYIAVEASLVFAIPKNVSFSQASTIPLAFATATQALYQQLRLPEPYSKNDTEQDILIYGASSSVGQYAVQLGRLSGLRVIAVASSKNHTFLRHLGADVTVDYHHDWVTEVKDITQRSLKYAFDCIAEGGTSEKIANILSCTESDHLVALSPLDKDAIRKINPPVKAASIMAFTVFGRPLDYPMFDNVGGPTLGEREAWEKYLRWLPDMLRKGHLEPNNAKTIGGLESVGKGFELSKENKLFGEKAVFQIS